MKTIPQTLRLAALLLAVAAFTQCARANNAFWIGLPDASVDTNWSDNLNWTNSTAASAGPAGNAVIFNNTNAQSSAGIIDNVVDQNGLNPTSMQYSNTSGFFHTTFIADGVTLTNSGALIIGGAPVVGGQSCSDAITGPGRLIVSGAVTINPAGGAPDSPMTLDMSGLNTFSNNAPTATMNLGTVAQAPVTFNLATNSFINVATLNLETTGGVNGRNGTINIGGGANTIWANSINISTGKGATSTIQFNNATTTGSVAIAGTGGTNRANILLGSGSSGSAVAHGNISLAGHFATVLASNVTMGAVASSDSGTGDTGVISIDNGIFDATRLLMGNSTTSSSGKSSSGTFNLGGSTNAATLIVNSPAGPGGGALILGNTGTVNETGSGTLNILSGGTAQIFCNISKSNATQNTATINLFGGSLALENATNFLGAPGVPIDNLSLSNATITLAVNGTTTNISAGLTLDGTNEVIDISSLPTGLIFGYPTAFPIIFYTQFNNSVGDNLSVVLPGTFHGVLSNDNVNTIYVVITNGPSVAKDDLWKGNISSAWDTNTANWTSSGAPATYNEQDQVTFDDTAVTKSVTLAVAHTPGKVTMNNASTYTFSGGGSIGGPGSLVLNGAGAVTLAETGGDNFSGGIAVNAGTLILNDANAAIGGQLSIAAGATVQIGNASTNGAVSSGGVTDNGSLVFDQTGNVTVGVGIGGTGTVTQSGTAILTLTGANTYTGNTIVTSGTLVLSGAGTIASSASVNVTGATLDVSAETGGVTLGALNLDNATIFVSTAYLKTNLNVASFATSGAANTINVTSLPPVASYPTAVPLIHSGSAISGLILNLGPLPVTTPVSVGNLTLSADQTTVLLNLTSGPTNLRPSTVWGGADAITAVNTNWSDALNWQSPGAPTTNDSVVFNETAAAPGGSALSGLGAGTNGLNLANVDNIVDKDFTVVSLTYTNLDGTYHNTFINSGKTLTTGTLAVGSQSLDFGSVNNEFVNIIGPGTLTVINTNTNSTLNVGLASTSSGAHQATLDMSGLGTFNASVGSVEIASVNSASLPMGGALYLAQNNNITISGGNLSETSQENQAGLSIGDIGNNGSGTSATLFLGQSTIINTGSVAVGCAKDNGSMVFNPNLIGNHPTVKFRGADGLSPVGNFVIGDGFGQTGGSSAPKGTVDFTGGAVDALIGTLNVGRSPNVSGAHSGTGIFTFEAGTVTVATLNDGLQPFSDTDFGDGTVNVNGTAVLNAATLNIAPITGGTGIGSDIGRLNITGATVAAGTINAGAGSTSTIVLNGGTLAVTNTAGTLAAPITELDLTGGTLHLSANGNLTDAELNVTAITTNGPTTLDIDSIINVAPLATVTNHLIAYTLNSVPSGSTGVDPFGALLLNAKPSGYNVSLVDNTANSTVDLVITSLVAPSRSVITSVSISGTTLNIHATNGEAGQPFVLLGGTNIAAPLNQWTNVATGSFGPDGTATLSTNVVNPAAPQEFFTISQ